MELKNAIKHKRELLLLDFVSNLINSIPDNYKFLEISVLVESRREKNQQIKYNTFTARYIILFFLFQEEESEGKEVGNLKCGKQPKISIKHKNKLNDVDDNDDDDDKINGENGDSQRGGGMRE